MYVVLLLDITSYQQLNL